MKTLIEYGIGFILMHTESQKKENNIKQLFISDSIFPLSIMLLRSQEKVKVSYFLNIK